MWVTPTSDKSDSAAETLPDVTPPFCSVRGYVPWIKAWHNVTLCIVDGKKQPFLCIWKKNIQIAVTEAKHLKVRNNDQSARGRKKKPHRLPGERHFDRISSFLAQYLTYCRVSFSRGVDNVQRSGEFEKKMCRVRRWFFAGLIHLERCLTPLKGTSLTLNPSLSWIFPLKMCLGISHATPSRVAGVRMCVGVGGWRTENSVLLSRRFSSLLAGVHPPTQSDAWRGAACWLGVSPQTQRRGEAASGTQITWIMSQPVHEGAGTQSAPLRW